MLQSLIGGITGGLSRGLGGLIANRISPQSQFTNIGDAGIMAAEQRAATETQAAEGAAYRASQAEAQERSIEAANKQWLMQSELEHQRNLETITHQNKEWYKYNVMMPTYFNPHGMDTRPEEQSSRVRSDSGLLQSAGMAGDWLFGPTAMDWFRSTLTDVIEGTRNYPKNFPTMGDY